MKEMKYYQKNLCIRVDQQEWLEAHPEINFSGMVRECLDGYIYCDKKGLGD